MAKVIVKNNTIVSIRSESKEDLAKRVNDREYSLYRRTDEEIIEKICAIEEGKIKSLENSDEESIESGKYSLSNVEARKWYLEQEAKIPDMIDKSLPLEEQAKQAFNLRNQFRTQARELMADRATAESLYKTDPNLTWEELVRKQSAKGLEGDDIYKAIIESSQRSRKSVNKSLGLE